MRVPPTPPEGRGPVQPGVTRGVAFGGIRRVRSRNCHRRDLGLGPAHAAVALEAGDGAGRRDADEPVAGRHRRAVVEQGRVPDHHGLALVVAHDDLELATRPAPEQASDRSEIALRLPLQRERALRFAQALQLVRGLLAEVELTR